MLVDTQRAKLYFYELHDITCNQKYNKNLPYSFHLEMTEAQGVLFKHLIFSNKLNYYNIFTGIYGHDSIEDARLTYNDIKNRYGKEIAEIIYLCTENRGRTKEQRKDDSFYQELQTNKEAVFVKLCDIIANTKFSLLSNSTMYEDKKKEYFERIKPFLYTEDFKQMFDYLEKIFTI
jgi:(p)ppGpp synthase/HD superfamily hydrolase